MCNEAKRERGFGFLAHITLPDGATGLVFIASHCSGKAAGHLHAMEGCGTIIKTFDSGRSESISERFN